MHLEELTATGGVTRVGSRHAYNFPGDEGSSYIPFSLSGEDSKPHCHSDVGQFVSSGIIKKTRGNGITLSVS